MQLPTGEWAVESANSELELANSELESADSELELADSELESADSELELADSSTDSNPDPSKIGVWVQAFSDLPFASNV